ncbi:MAG: LptA/OstA family protein [Elusimicrobia bacterium]|nr:LptA/OstA family protein [Elusimicrobiota bacterium]
MRKKSEAMNYNILFIVLLVCFFTNIIYSGEPIMITGDRTKILQKGDIVEYIGNVKLVQENIKVKADEMKSNERTGIITSSGNICVQYSSGTTETYTWGNTAEYNKNTGSGVILGNVKAKRFLSQNTTSVMELTSEKLEIFNYGEDFHATKNVYIQYSSATTNTNVWGETAEFNKNSGSGVILDNVKVKRYLSQCTTDFIEMTCEKLEIFNFGENLHAMKNVNFFKEQTKTQSDEAIYDQKAGTLLLLGGPPKLTRVEDKNSSEYTGDKILLEIEKEKITISGNTKTKMITQ